MSYALVFSGQGTQHPAMLSWLGDDGILRSMCGRLGIADWRNAVADAGWAQRNEHAQTLLTGLSLSAWHQVAPGLPPPAAIAGYSVGELAAFSAAGLYDAETALDLSLRRARAMDRCAETSPGGLLAVSGASSDLVDRICRTADLAVAIRNGGGAFVVGGTHRALDLGEDAFIACGARCTRLRIGVASHTPSMRSAAEEFRRTLQGVAFDRPRIALFGNAADRIREADGARQALANQISTTVRWDECMENIYARRVDAVLEVGPGAALAKMWNERYADVPARSCDEFRDPRSVTRWLSGLATGRAAG